MKQFELRKWKLEDAEQIAVCANNQKIAANLRNTFPYPYTLADAKAFIAFCMEGGEDHQINRVIAVDGKAAGGISVSAGSDVYEKSGELGYWLAEEYWGQGIMSGAVREICRQAFNRFDLVRIYADPFAYNTGSRRVLEKSGFSLEGVMKQGVYKWGKLHDYCVYALLKEG